MLTNYIKRLSFAVLALAAPAIMNAQGWPANYGGVMLQGFHWNSFVDSRWEKFEAQADELSQYFDLIWIPQSGKCGGSSMGYDPLYFFDQNSTFGTEAQLRSMISTLKAKNVGIIGDVVINHHSTLTGWFTFPAETYKGVTYQLKSTDICRDDDGGATLAEANKQGVSLSSNYDTGQDWSGARDLDHYSSNVQTIVKAYLKFLIDDIGLTGFRYDMVRGFSGSFVGIYNNYAKPSFSVGEHWTNSETIIGWMNSTKVNNQIQSGAFDFDFRYTVRNAFNNYTANSLGQKNGGDSNWPMVSCKFGNAGYLNNGYYRQFAVTFVENHDVEDRGNVEDYNADPLRRDTVAANAFMMAMPGTPCVFLTHWQDCKQDIKGLIDVRKAVGITNTSSYSELYSTGACYAIQTDGAGSKKLITIVGTKTNAYTPSASTWTKVVDGYHYAYYMNRASETAWIDKASGYYSTAQNVTMTAVSANGSAKLVYTTDGSEPTATNGTQVNSGYVLRLKEPMTLKVGLLVGSTIKNVQTRVYDLPEIEDFKPHWVSIYFRDPSRTVSTWTKPYYWAYDNHGSLNTATSWPGDAMTDTVTIRNALFFYKKFYLDEEDNSINILFTSPQGTPQTVDITGITKDTYYQLGTLNGQGKYTVTNVTRFYESSNPLNRKTGDVDGNGIVDTADLAIVIDAILGLSDNTAADVDGNGIVDTTDMALVIDIILGN